MTLKKPWISVPKIKSMLISDNMWIIMKTAIVILNWNGERMLKTYLDCVKKFKGEAEVIVADNASTDGSVTICANTIPTFNSSSSTRTMVLPRDITRHSDRWRRSIMCCSTPTSGSIATG